MVSGKRIHDRIVVGVDGSTASHQAVLWAAAEARLRHGDLIITHIEPAVPGIGPTRDLAAADRHELLAASATAASSRQPAVAVGSLLIHGDISDELILLSQTSAVLVVGVDRAVPRAAHGATGPIEDRVVAHARCPVVIVAEQSTGNDEAHNRVLVGLTPDPGALDVLNAAAEEAVTRRAALRLITGRAEGSAALRPKIDPPSQAEALQDVIRALAQAHPELTVTSVDVGDQLADKLKRESMIADLVVVGSAQSEDRWSIRTGALSSGLIRESHCPVMLVGHRVGHRSKIAEPAA